METGQPFEELLCRTCLSKEGCIYLLSNNDSTLYSDMLDVCTSVKVTPEDNKPQLICNICVCRLKEAFEFRRMCQKSAARLEQLTSFSEVLPVTVDLEEVSLFADSLSDSSQDDLLLQMLNTEPRKMLDDRMKNSETNKDCDDLKDSINICEIIETDASCLTKDVDIKQEDDLDQMMNKTEENYEDNFPKERLKNDLTKPKGKYFCDICGHCVKVKWDLIVHLRKHTKQKPFRCGICGKSYSWATSLRHHEKQHTGERAFMCDVCGKRLATLDTLAAHQRLHTGEKPCRCCVCGKDFRSKANLYLHQKVHTEDRRHACQICHKRFYTTSDLSRHTMCHTKEKPFPCELCGRGFTSKVYLSTHLLRHADKKDFQCPLCFKMFYTKDSLKRHMLVHNGNAKIVKTFKCYMCESKFSHKATLESHVKHRHADKCQTYLCTICHLRYHYPSGLRVHFKKHHSNISKAEYKQYTTVELVD